MRGGIDAPSSRIRALFALGTRVAHEAKASRHFVPQHAPERHPRRIAAEPCAGARFDDQIACRKKIPVIEVSRPGHGSENQCAAFVAPGTREAPRWPAAF